MNNAIYLTLKKLNNQESVSKNELKKAFHVHAASSTAWPACAVAFAAAYAANVFSYIDAVDAAHNDPYAYADTVTYAYIAIDLVSSAAENNQEIASQFIDEYFKITGENKQDYLDKIRAYK